MFDCHRLCGKEIFIGLLISSDHVMKSLLSRWWSLIRSHQSVMFSSLGYEYEYGDISLLICYVSSTDQQIKGVTLQYGWWHFTLGDNLVKLCGCEHQQCRDTLLFICYLSTRNHIWPLKYGNKFLTHLSIQLTFFPCS